MQTLNLIRLQPLARLLSLCEAPTMTCKGASPAVAARRPGPLVCGHDQKENVNGEENGVTGWLEWLRTEGSGRVIELSREIPRDQNGVHGPYARRAARGEVRASVVAWKRGNARGAKGRRKVEA